MSKPMLEFFKRPPEMPQKRPADIRREDFSEIYGEYIREKAEAQSARCSQCGIPFCQDGCPLHNNIPDWLYLAAQDELQDAYITSTATNPMPEICGRICPQDRLCEGACVVEQSGHGAITIGAVEKFLTDTAWNEGWVEAVNIPQERDKSVGIVGAGPAGLAAAEALREQGWQVTIYDRHDRAGGLLMYGIPNFKLDKHVVERRIKRLEKASVKFVLNTNIGKDIQFDELRGRHDAILLATGVYKPRVLEVPGSGAKGVMQALPFLIDANKRGLGDQAGGDICTNKNIIVVGGGDTAMDCVRTAIRQGAKSVICLYRRDESNMPGSARETANAKEEGVEFKWLSAPKSIHDRDGKVSKLRAVRMRLGPKDKDGRQSVIPIEDAEFDLEADLVIQALGFTPENMHVFDPDMKLTRWGTISVDPYRFETNLPGVFAAGDIVRGASLVVWAIREGRDAAKAIHAHLMTPTKTQKSGS